MGGKERNGRMCQKCGVDGVTRVSPSFAVKRKCKRVRGRKEGARRRKECYLQLTRHWKRCCKTERKKQRKREEARGDVRWDLQEKEKKWESHARHFYFIFGSQKVWRRVIGIIRSIRHRHQTHQKLSKCAFGLVRANRIGFWPHLFSFSLVPCSRLLFPPSFLYHLFFFFSFSLLSSLSFFTNSNQQQPTATDRTPTDNYSYNYNQQLLIPRRKHIHTYNDDYLGTDTSPYRNALLRHHPHLPLSTAHRSL